MSMILYHSKTSQTSNELVTNLTKAGILQPNIMHVLCIDQRVQDNTGKWYIVHGSGKILMPNLSQIPALMLLKENNRIIYQKQQIEAYLAPLLQKQTAQATNYAQEPEAFSLDTSSGISSDSYSHLDDRPEDLSVERGNASMRQMRHYVSLRDTEQVPGFAGYPQQQQKHAPPGGAGTIYQPFVQPAVSGQSTSATPRQLESIKIEKNSEQNKAEIQKQMQYVQNQREQDAEFFKKQFPQTY